MVVRRGTPGPDILEGTSGAGILSGLDLIDLAAVDARSGIAGDQAFASIGAAAFTAPAASSARFMSPAGCSSRATPTPRPTLSLRFGSRVLPSGPAGFRPLPRFG